VNLVNEHDLLALGYRLELWTVDGNDICVSYTNCEVKDGIMLKTVFGRGRTLQDACYDYHKQIKGKTLVFNSNKEGGCEVRVL